MPLKIDKVSCKPPHVELPPKTERAVLGTEHSEHPHHTSVDLMALDDHEVCLKAALATTLVVFLTLEKRRQARTLTEWALILEVLKDIVYSIHGDVKEVRERGWR